MRVFDNHSLKGQAWPWKRGDSLEGAKGGFMLACITKQCLFREVQPAAAAAAAATGTKKKKKKQRRREKKRSKQRRSTLVFFFCLN